MYYGLVTCTASKLKDNFRNISRRSENFTRREYQEWHWITLCQVIPNVSHLDVRFQTEACAWREVWQFGLHSPTIQLRTVRKHQLIKSDQHIFSIFHNVCYTILPKWPNMFWICLDIVLVSDLWLKKKSTNPLPWTQHSYMCVYKIGMDLLVQKLSPEHGWLVATWSWCRAERENTSLCTGNFGKEKQHGNNGFAPDVMWGGYKLGIRQQNNPIRMEPALLPTWCDRYEGVCNSIKLKSCFIKQA